MKYILDCTGRVLDFYEIYNNVYEIYIGFARDVYWNFVKYILVFYDIFVRIIKSIFGIAQDMFFLFVRQPKAIPGLGC